MLQPFHNAIWLEVIEEGLGTPWRGCSSAAACEQLIPHLTLALREAHEHMCFGMHEASRVVALASFWLVLVQPKAPKVALTMLGAITDTENPLLDAGQTARPGEACQQQHQRRLALGHYT